MATEEETKAPTVVYAAGFWLRFWAFLVDCLVLAVVFGLCIVADLVLFHGELGTFRYYKVVDRLVLEERTEATNDGAVVTYGKNLETWLDYNDRAAKVEIEYRATNSGSAITTWRSVRRLEADPDWGGKYRLYYALFFFLVLVGYPTLMWASIYQATLGGLLLKIEVIDYDGEEIGYARSLARTFAMAFLCILFFVVAFTKKKQGLHDLLTKTLVVRRT